MNDTAVPVAPAERIDVLDAIRGSALIGIFIMNMPFFNTSFFASADGVRLWPQWWDVGAAAFRDVVFSGKFNSMFSMLFAVGFTIQLERLAARAPGRAVGIYLRRIFWLFMIGVAHACVFWTGDILHMYALLGLVLLLIRHVPDRIIVGAIVACLLYPIAAGMIRISGTETVDVERMVALAQQWTALDNEIYRHGTFGEIVARNTQTMWALYMDPDLRWTTIGGYVQILTTMLIGLLLGRRRVFQQIESHLPLVRALQWWALGVGLVCAAVFAAYGLLIDTPLAPSLFGIVARMCYAVCRIALTVFYVALIMRATQSAWWHSHMASLTLAGRMPLTNYLLQTLIATSMFFGWGLGLWGTIGPAFDLVLAIAIFFLVQVPLAKLWFRHFRIGPMEYLWRVLTYGRDALGVTRRDGARDREVAVS